MCYHHTAVNHMHVWTHIFVSVTVRACECNTRIFTVLCMYVCHLLYVCHIVINNMYFDYWHDLDELYVLITSSKQYFHYYTFQDILITKFTYIQLYNYLCIHMKKQEVGLALTWLYQIILWTLRYIQITWYTFVPNPCDGYYIYVCFCSIQSDNNSSTK